METSISRDELLDDVVFLRRFQLAGAWCGPLFLVLLFGGWGLMGGFIPLISAADTPAEVAAAWAADQYVSLIGLSFGMLGTFVTLPFYLTTSLQMRRAERGTPVLSILQFASGVVITTILAIPMVIFIVGAFRPERSPELMQVFNDLSYILLILPWPPIVLQVGSVALVILRDRRPDPVFPRWLAYFNLWVAFLVIPANLIVFFMTGPFAWTGIIGFWIPAAVFGVWYAVMFQALVRAIDTEAAEERARIEAMFPARTS